MVHFGRTEIARIHFDELVPVEVRVCEGKIQELSDGMSLAGADHIVIGGILLQNSPHGADIVGRVAPVAASVHVSYVKFVLQAELDVSNGACDFSGYESFATARRFMVKQNST